VAQAGCRSSATPYAIKLHGSELEYAIRGNPRLARLAVPPLDGADAVYAGSRHILDVTRQLLGDGRYLARAAIVPPGVDVEDFRPERGSRERLDRLLRDDRPGAHRERHPDPDAAQRLQPVGPFLLYFGKLLRQKGVHLLLEAWRELAPAHPEMWLVVVGFGSDREWLESQAGPRVVFTGAMDHAQLQALVPLAELVVVPSVLPEAFGMVAAEAASSGVMTVVADHSGLAEVAAGLGDAARTFEGGAQALAAAIASVLALPPDHRREAGARGRGRVVDRWSWERIAERLAAGIPQNGEGASP
jgi:glycosyltransferase involved in cell wall biosynthesis